MKDRNSSFFDPIQNSHNCDSALVKSSAWKTAVGCKRRSRRTGKQKRFLEIHSPRADGCDGFADLPWDDGDVLELQSPSGIANVATNL